MRRILFIILTVIIGTLTAKSQFQTTDSLERFINRYIRNSAVEAFQNLRLNTAMIGMLKFIDSAYGGQIASISATSDTTFRIITLNDDTLTTVVVGRHWTLQQVLTNGSVLTTNHTITIADSITYASGKVLIDQLRLTGLVQQTDTSTYKPLARDALGNVVGLDRWPGSGSGGSGGGLAYNYSATAPTGADTAKVWIKTPAFCAVYDVYTYITGFGWTRHGWLSADGVFSAKRPINILLSGQSNAAGYTSPSGDTASMAGILGYSSGVQNNTANALDAPIQWQPVRIGLSPFYLSNNNIAFQVAKRLKKNRDADIVRVIAAYRGGTSLGAWISAGHYMLDTLRNRLTRSGIDTIDIFLWHQGEDGGVTAETSGGYVVDQRVLYDSLCSSLTPGFFRNYTKYIAGGLGTDTVEATVYNVGSAKGGQRVLNWDNNPNTAWVNAWNLHTTDGVHFKGTSIDTLGNRYYAAAKSLPHAEEKAEFNYNPTYDGYTASVPKLLPYFGAGIVAKDFTGVSFGWTYSNSLSLWLNAMNGSANIGNTNGLPYTSFEKLNVLGRMILHDDDGNSIISGNFHIPNIIQNSVILGNYGTDWTSGGNVVQSVLIGKDAGYSTSNGPENSVMIGYRAGRNVIDNGDGDYNTYIGYEAAQGSQMKGSISIGNFSGTSSRGAALTFVGGDAKAINSTDWSYSTAVGYGSRIDRSNMFAAGDSVNTYEFRMGKWRWDIDPAVAPADGQYYGWSVADGKFKLTTPTGSLSGSGTSGQLALWNGSSSFTGNSNILWGTSNGPRISIGTTNTQGVLNVGGNKNLTSSGAQSFFAGATYTDAVTASSGTASSYTINYIASPTIAATNTSVTFPNITTLAVEAPTAGTNATITNSYAFQTGTNGHAKIQGNTEVDGALMAGGAQYNAVTTITADATLATTVYWVEVNATSGNITITLPAASSVFTGARGIMYKLARVDASGNTVTVQRAGSDTIGAAGTSFSLNTADEVKTLQCVANNKWRVF